MLQNEPTLAIVAVDTEENERLRFGVNYSVYSFTSLVHSHVNVAFGTVGSRASRMRCFSGSNATRQETRTKPPGAAQSSCTSPLASRHGAPVLLRGSRLGDRARFEQGIQFERGLDEHGREAKLGQASQRSSAPDRHRRAVKAPTLKDAERGKKQKH